MGTIHRLSAKPSARLGDIGDYALDFETFMVFGPKTREGWGPSRLLRSVGLDDDNLRSALLEAAIDGVPPAVEQAYEALLAASPAGKRNSHG